MVYDSSYTSDTVLPKLTYIPLSLSLADEPADKPLKLMTGAEKKKYYREKKRAKARERRRAYYQKVKLKREQEKAEREREKAEREKDLPKRELTKEEKRREWRRQYMKRKRQEEKEKNEKEEKRKEKDRERHRRNYWAKKAAAEQEQDESSEEEVECTSSLQCAAVQTDSLDHQYFGEISGDFYEQHETAELTSVGFSNYDEAILKEENSLESDMYHVTKVEVQKSDSSDKEEPDFIIKEELID